MVCTCLFTRHISISSSIDLLRSSRVFLVSTSTSMELERRTKRAFREESSSSQPNQKRKRSSSPPPTSKRPTFDSYLQVPNLPPKIKLVCEILSTTPPQRVEASLEDTGLLITSQEVEDVLKLSYAFPGPTVKFFRWAGRQLNENHSPYAWNLIVDLLGKNFLFNAMWDAIKSMKTQGLLSLATFASVFSSYVVADRVDEAIMTFEVMDQYGCARDVVALNSLLSAICRQGKTVKGREFLHIAMGKIRPDEDSFAILLEGWEIEGDVANAHKTYGEMVTSFGWNPANVPAHDAFLSTLLKGHRDGVNEAMKFFQVLKEKRCFPGMKFYQAALDKLVSSKQTREALSLWEGMVRGSIGCRPDTKMYNSMISLQCFLNQADAAFELLDEMIVNGTFPDSQTYNVLLQFLLEMRKMRDVTIIFNESIKNECTPSEEICATAVKAYIDLGLPEMAIKIWKCMLGNEMSDLETTGNLLIVGLRDLNRMSEARKYSEDMIERSIKLSSKTLSKLRQGFSELKKPYLYDELLKKWKAKSRW